MVHYGHPDQQQEMIMDANELLEGINPDEEVKADDQWFLLVRELTNLRNSVF